MRWGDTEWRRGRLRGRGTKREERGQEKRGSSEEREEQRGTTKENNREEQWKREGDKDGDWEGGGVWKGPSNS